VTGLLKGSDLIALAKKLVQIGMPMLPQMLVAPAELDDEEEPERDDAPFMLLSSNEAFFFLPDDEWMLEHEFRQGWGRRFPDLTDRSTLLIVVDWVRQWAIECGANRFEVSHHIDRYSGDSFVSISVNGLATPESFFGDSLGEALYNAMVVLAPRAEEYEAQARQLISEGYEASEGDEESPYLTREYLESKMFDMPIVYAVRRLKMKGET